MTQATQSNPAKLKLTTMTKLTQIFFLLTLCVTQSAFGTAKVIKQLANELIVESSAKYVLGDNDTRIDARNIALNEAKRAASELAGTQVKSDLIIENDQILKDQITIVAASFMTVEVLKEAMTTSQEGRSVMEVTIRAHLDKSAIRSKLDAYRSDDKRQKELRSIQAENTRLQNELESLNDELSKIRNAANNGSVSQKPRAELVARRDVVISSIEESQGQVRRVFEKGTLLGMAKKSGDAYQVALEVLDKQVIGYIKNNTKVVLGEPQFQDNGNGTYDVLVSVKWDTDPSPAVKKLNDYFKLDNNNYKESNVGISKFSNEKDDQKLPFTNKLYLHLVKRSAVIRVKVGNKSGDLTIATGLECFVSCNVSGTDKFQWIPSSSKISKLEAAYDEQNPVVIRNVPEKLLKEQSAITAEIVIK